MIVFLTNEKSEQQNRLAMKKQKIDTHYQYKVRAMRSSKQLESDYSNIIMKAHISNQFQLQLPLRISRLEQDLLRSIHAAWNQSQRDICTIQIPMSNRMTIITLYYFLHQMVERKKACRMMYIVETKQRKNLILGILDRVKKLFFKKRGIRNIDIGINARFFHFDNEMGFMVLTFEEYISDELLKPENLEYIFVETSHIGRMISGGVEDYITDTYVRRAQIECCNMIQAYKTNSKFQDQNLEMEDNEQIIPLISLVSSERNPSYDQNNISRATDGISALMQVFQNKKNSLKENVRKQNTNSKEFFEQNQMVLLSIMMYILSFLQKSLDGHRNKTIKSIRDFFNDFENKTLLNQKILIKMAQYYRFVFKNCPVKIQTKLEETYLYTIWNFFKKIVTFSQLFHHEQGKMFQIKIQQFPEEKHENIVEDSTCAIKFCCSNDRVAALKMLQQKAKCVIISQNIGCPNQYWKYNYLSTVKVPLKNEQSILRKRMLERIFGVHISKTHSNQDLNFSKVERKDVESIKMKAIGVLLAQLCRIVPDGMVVYFYSYEGMQAFRKQMEKGEENIFDGINEKKKVFFEAEFEEENQDNINNYKKYCSIGRGGIFILSTSSKIARKHSFYKNLSNCILFIGLPQRRRSGVSLELNKQLEHQVEEMERLSIFNMCLNNCINDPMEYKTVIFVGREITSNLQAYWYAFIRKWDETTRDSFSDMKKHYQQMRSPSF